MKKNRIVWFEGMTLDPHHFQQWDQYHKAELNFRVSHYFSNFWGLSDILIEKEALLNGQLQLSEISGIMPDGLSFSMPDDSPLPSTRNFSEYFSATQDNIAIFLGIPYENSGSKICELDINSNNRETRYHLQNLMVADENTGSDNREIGIGRPNFQIYFSGESLEGLSTLKIGEIVRSSEGESVLSQSYIPPCLIVKASENLISKLNKLLELFVARSNDLRNRRRQTAAGQLEVNLSDLSLYWHLSTLNSYIPIIDQFVSLGKYHPQCVYETLISLAGQLISFSTDDELLPTDFPAYDQNNLGLIFNGVDSKIRRLLEGKILPSKPFIKLNLNKEGENKFHCKIEDPSLLNEAELYLVCSGNILENKSIQDLTAKFRIASLEMIDEVLRTMINALRILFTPSPPAGIPDKQGVFYFKLEKQGPFWKAIEESQALSIYIPMELVSIQLELIAVKVRES